MTRSQRLAAAAVVVPAVLLLTGEIINSTQSWDTTGGWGQFAMMAPRVVSVWAFSLGMTGALLFSKPARRPVQVAAGWLILALACVYVVAGGVGLLGLAFWVAPYLGATLIVFLPVSLTLFHLMAKPAVEAQMSAQEGSADAPPKRASMRTLFLCALAGFGLFVVAGALAQLANGLGANILANVISYGFGIVMLIALAISLASMYARRQVRGARQR